MLHKVGNKQYVLFHNEDNPSGFLKSVVESDETWVMKCIQDVNFSFKLFFLARPRFDELGTKSCGGLKFHALFHDAKSAPKK